MKNLNLNRKEKLLFLSPALVLLIPLWNHFRGDMMDQAQRELAGSEAINCGVGHIVSIENNEFDVERDDVDACSVAAFKAKKPFIARYDTLGDNDPHSINTGSFGITGTPDGKIYFSYYQNLSYWWSSSMDWRNGSNRWRQKLCSKPKLYSYPNKARKMRANAVIGCGTCDVTGSGRSATCILFP